MKKLIASGLTFFMLISSISGPAFAAKQEGKEDASGWKGSKIVELEYKRPDQEHKVVLKVPKFKPDPDCDEDERVYYSSQGKLSLNLDKCPNFSSKACISVEIAKPEMKRCWKTINPIKFGRKIIKADPAENSFVLKGPLRQAEWWNIKNRVKYWWKPQTIDVNYAIVLTSPEEESVLEAKEVQEGQKKKEVVDDEKAIEKIEALNAENDDIAKIRKKYLDRLRRDDDYDSMLFRMEGRRYLRDRQKIDKSLYYTKEEADKINKGLREKKEKVLLSLANKKGKDLITSGEVTKLSKAHPEQTFRLIINNNMGDCEAAKLSIMLSNCSSYNFRDSGSEKLKFKSNYVRPLPDYLEQECYEEDLAYVISDMKTVERKKTFSQFLGQFVPDILKELYDFCTDDHDLGSKVSKWTQWVKDKMPKKRDAVEEEPAVVGEFGEGPNANAVWGPYDEAQGGHDAEEHPAVVGANGEVPNVVWAPGDEAEGRAMPREEERRAAKMYPGTARHPEEGNVRGDMSLMHVSDFSGRPDDAEGPAAGATLSGDQSLVEKRDGLERPLRASSPEERPGDEGAEEALRDDLALSATAGRPLQGGNGGGEVQDAKGTGASIRSEDLFASATNATGTLGFNLGSTARRSGWSESSSSSSSESD